MLDSCRLFFALVVNFAMLQQSQHLVNRRIIIIIIIITDRLRTSDSISIVFIMQREMMFNSGAVCTLRRDLIIAASLGAR